MRRVGLDRAFRTYDLSRDGLVPVRLRVFMRPTHRAGFKVLARADLTDWKMLSKDAMFLKSQGDKLQSVWPDTRHEEWIAEGSP